MHVSAHRTDNFTVGIMTVLLLGVMSLASTQSTDKIAFRGYKDKASRKLGNLPQCENMMMNGNFEGSLEGWSAHGGGSISLFDDSAHNNTASVGNCLLFSGRTSKNFGPAYELLPECFTSGATYRISAYMKLAVNATTDYQPFYCDRSLTGSDIWQNPNVCPMLTFEVKTSSGHRHWAYGASSTIDDWMANEWNEFTADLLVTDVISDATEVKMYFERVRENVDILLDGVTITEVEGNLDELGQAADYAMYDQELNCSHMVMNSDFEEGNQTGWTTHLGGKLLLYPYGYGGSGNALLYTARHSSFVGPRHSILPRCVTEGKKYQIEAQMKLLDEQGLPFVCDKSKPWDHEVSCPLLTVSINDER